MCLEERRRVGLLGEEVALHVVPAGMAVSASDVPRHRVSRLRLGVFTVGDVGRRASHEVASLSAV
jgi:hypothetical protein